MKAQTFASFRVAHTFEKAAVESVRCLHVRGFDALRLPVCDAHQERTAGGPRDARLTRDPSTSWDRGAQYGAPAQHPNTDTYCSSGGKAGAWRWLPCLYVRKSRNNWKCSLVSQSESSDESSPEVSRKPSVQEVNLHSSKYGSRGSVIIRHCGSNNWISLIFSSSRQICVLPH